MAEPQAKNFNLPWHQYDRYWIAVGMEKGELPVTLMQALKTAGMQLSGPMMVLETPREWKSYWDAVYAVLIKARALDLVKTSVTPGPTPPSSATVDWRTPVSVQHIAESLWLGEALMDDRILCYLQPVVSTRDKVFGYESFARAQAVDGSIISGDKIIAASRALNIEYVIDRHLHVQAITTFVCSDFDGFLFVNLSPGFIHRPEVYLEGLADTVKTFGIVAKHIVLDFTRAEKTHDLRHMRSVCEYGRKRGYSIALDDMETLDGAKRMVADIRPDFVKIDMKLSRRVDDPAKRQTIAQIVALVHGVGGTVIAEGVETEEMFQALKTLGVDLFQGYYFSPPVPVEAVIKRSTGTA